MPYLKAYYDRKMRIEAEPLPDNIPALLEAAAADMPERLAYHFIATNETATYAELAEQVNKLANGLLSIGVRGGSHVALMMPNIPAWPITWLALARLGAVAVPINVRYTSRELLFGLEDAEVDAFIVDAQYLDAVRGLTSLPERMRERVFVVGDDAAEYRPWSALWEGQPERCTAPLPDLDTLMNIQYTSGTTGLPKGCLLSHRYWLTCAKSHADIDGLKYENILASNPYFYMTPQWLTLMAFFQRATLFVASHRSGSKTMEWIREHGIHFCLLNKIVYDQPSSLEDASNEVKKVCIYGFPKSDQLDLEERFGFPAREAFGMTEIGAGLFVPLDASDMTGSGSAGIAGPFRECRVADAEGNTVPANQTGELLFRGPGMLQGYYRRPDANETGFHGEWFRTGDLARQDERGFVYIVGRIKDMVRRAGENIAAREVEEVLAKMPGIAEVAVVPVPDDLRGEEVKVHVRMRNGMEPIDPEALLAYCALHLAVFKIPRYVEFRAEEFPKSPSGKIRKGELQAEKPDQRSDSWDRVLGRWLTPSDLAPETGAVEEAIENGHSVRLRC
ncbi:class I adenylate-forming enzyme family protein [Aquamicrobium ahrensii]|uniref:Crotonobetaine/carnitine-CoA ligase n=1 Tax=Aquamicrobium ahrensii TaxID=469551 RepID=A0ABV2KQG6_9HYPH